jgi:hypothetical protein
MMKIVATREICEHEALSIMSLIGTIIPLIMNEQKSAHLY